MPGPGYTSPNNQGSKRSEAFRQVLRERFGDYGNNKRDLKNRNNRKPKPKDGVDRMPIPKGYKPPTQFPSGSKAPGHWGQRA